MIEQTLSDAEILAFVKAAPALQTAELEWLHVCRQVEQAIFAKLADGQEPLMYVYRNINLSDDVVEGKWEVVSPRRFESMEARLSELRQAQYRGKPLYEVRGVYLHPAPPSDTRIKFYKREIDELEKAHRSNQNHAESWLRLVQHAQLSGNDLDVQYQKDSRAWTDKLREAAQAVVDHCNTFMVREQQLLAEVEKLREALK